MTDKEFARDKSISDAYPKIAGHGGRDYDPTADPGRAMPTPDETTMPNILASLNRLTGFTPPAEGEGSGGAGQSSGGAAGTEKSS